MSQRIVQYEFNPGSIPDGYWEIRAVAFNIYNEPGQYVATRVRVEKDAPANPTCFVATAQSDNQSVVLNWAAGSERDRSRYVDRQKAMGWRRLAPMGHRGIRPQSLTIHIHGHR